MALSRLFAHARHMVQVASLCIDDDFSGLWRIEKRTGCGVVEPTSSQPDYMLREISGGLVQKFHEAGNGSGVPIFRSRVNAQSRNFPASMRDHSIQPQMRMSWVCALVYAGSDAERFWVLLFRNSPAQREKMPYQCSPVLALAYAVENQENGSEE